MTAAARSAVIRRLTDGGLALDVGDCDALVSISGADDAAGALAALAADPECGEYAPFAALLFSPDRPAMRALEPALAAENLDAAGAEALGGAVAERLAGTRLPVTLPGGNRREYSATAEDLRGYVRRLRPEATPPAGLRAILARRFAPDVAADLAVTLRHSRLAWTPAREFFLATLLDRLDLATDDAPALVAWAVDFLDTAGLPFAPRRALSARRAALEAQLRQAEAAEKALEQGNFEMRFAQGLRLGHVHGPDVRRETALLDRACRLVLGISGEASKQGGVTARDLGEMTDVAELLRLLP